MMIFPPRILVTGFEPFAGADDNPSARVVERLARLDRPGVHAAVLPVSAARMPGVLAGLLAAHRPDVVLGLGEARGAAAVRVECAACNELDFTTPDNDGRVLTGSPVIAGAAATRATTLPVDDLLACVRTAGLPCEPSDRAGRYLCNQMMYLALHWAAAAAHGPRVGFLHLPSLPTQNTSMAGAGHPTMELNDTRRAVDAVLAYVCGLA